MNNTPLDLTTQHTLALLQQLKKAVAEAAQAEEQLASEMRTRRFNADRKLHKAEEGIDDRVTSQFAEAEAVFGAREEKARKAHEDREARLKRYKNSSSRNLQSMAQEQRERFLGGVQMKRVTMERAHARKVQAIEQRHAAEQARLAEFDLPLLNLQKAVKKAFSGYGSYLALLSQPVEIAATTDHNEQVAALEEMLGRAQRRYATFRKNALPRFFSTMPLMMLIALFAVLGLVLAIGLGAGQKGMIIGGAVAAAGILGSVVLHMIGRKQGDADAEEAATTLGAVRALHRGAVTTTDARRDEELAAEKQSFEGEFSHVKGQWEGADKVQADFETKIKTKLATKVPELIERNDSILGSKLRYLNAKRDELKRKLDEEAAAQKKVHVLTRDRTMTEIVADEAQRFGEIEKSWKAEVQPLWAELEAMRAAPAMNFPAWSKAYLDAWSAPHEFSAATRYGSVTLDLATAGLPKDPRLALPGDATIVQPLGLSYPAGGSLLIESEGASDGVVSNALNTVLLRLICTTPPGKIAFTILDPVGLGQNFAGFMHLGDYEETLINRRIWTQRDQIEERLAELNDHIEKVIQMYLRNEYETITQYNEQAGSVAEKYHFLVVADFPAGFSDVAAKRLQSIAVSGPRCGVYTIIHRDVRQSLPDGFVADELKQASVCITLDRQGRFTLPAAPEGSMLALDAPPPDDLAVPLVHKIGKASIDSNRVEVPFTQISPKPDELWTNDTTNELRIPIGRTGATKLQYLAIGKGTRQHALFAGKTGSGKSTLFHVIITNLALACSPDQVEFYLIDFKKGVEFKCYATNRLPHARVVAIESDREFGLSVLQRVDEELKRRGDMFRKLGVQDVAGYKRAGGTEPMPRTLLLIDEFQEFFVEDDTVAQNASLLFDRIVRQGRAFGIHVLLGSQTLGGAFTLARATMGQMVIRVALQCNEADAYLIMDENNPAPRLLTRPGEGIYNDSAGAIEGNSPFQVVWLGDEERDACLHKVRQLAEERHDPHRGPIVFEGNAPADIRENYALAAALDKKPEKAPPAGRIWLGAPNSIKGPTEAVFHRQSGNHLLIVGQREEVALSMLGLGLIAVASQYPAGGAKYYFFHTTTPETPDARFVDRMLSAVPEGVRVVRGHDVPDAMTELAEMLAERTATGGQDAPPVFVFIHGLQKFKKLKSDDDLDFSFSSSDSGPSPASQFSSLITEGSSHGIHLITSVDTYNNVMRFLSRKLLTEFEMRLVFQMSANDSASLIDSPRAANLGMHRALLHNEQEGSLETFRPYAEPDGLWLDEVAEKLRQR